MRNPTVHGAALALALLATDALTQTSLPFPMRAAAPDALTALPALEADASALALLASPAAREVVLRGLELPGAGAVDLELSKVDLARRGFGFQVDGSPAPGLLDALDLSVWTGRVVGAAQSEVVLALSNRGVRGWVTRDGDLVHLVPLPDASGDWGSSRTLLAREDDLLALGLRNDFTCAAETTSSVAPVPTRESLGAQPASYAGSCSFWECRIAIETDWQLNQVFGGDLGAESAYLASLLAAISARYEEQIDTVLTFPYVQFYTSPADPWSTPDVPGSTSTMLSEFESAWAGSVPGGAVLGHFVSGASLGGGIAYLGALCDTSQTFSFAVSGNISGQVPFPIAVGPLNWDFMVIAHETGHNFNSPHTHDYVPQIDNCAGGTCITNGTLMSYCHLCPGGLSNITTYFHEPTVTNVMKAHAGACLPFFSPLVVDVVAQPTLVGPGTPTTVSVTLQGTPVGTVDLNWRLSGGAFATTPMTHQGGGVYAADVPAASCGDQPEWFFSVVDADCGPFQTQTFSADVGVATIVLHEDFEGGSAFTSGAAGDSATTGLWTRGNPIGTAAQPEDDVTALGTDCWFTGQGSPGGSVGENDVDGGTTTLLSPVVDLSGGDARIGYWRWFNNEAGSNPNDDAFTVDVSNDGSSWTNVETVGPAAPGTSGGWIYHEFTVSDHVAPSATVRVRFRATDAGVGGSIVEAAIDEFSVFRVDCATTCQTDLGFGGPGSGVLSMCGGDLSTGTTADLLLTGAVPNATAFLLAGVTFATVPFKGGTLVPVPWLLLAPLPTDGNGDILVAGVPGGGGPASIYFQYAWADGAQPLGFALSNAVRADFLP